MVPLVRLTGAHMVRSVVAIGIKIGCNIAIRSIGFVENKLFKQYRCHYMMF
jgi:hypothetical protein